MLESILELPVVADESKLFEDACPTSFLSLQPHQHTQAGLSTGAGGLELASAVTRRVSELVGSVCGMQPKVVTDMSGPLGESVSFELPGTQLVRATR